MGESQFGESDAVRGKELMCDQCGCTRWACLTKFDGACCDGCDHPDPPGGIVLLDGAVVARASARIQLVRLAATEWCHGEATSDQAMSAVLGAVGCQTCDPRTSPGLPPAAEPGQGDGRAEG